MVCVRNVQEQGKCNYCMRELSKSLKVFLFRFIVLFTMVYWVPQHQWIVLLLQYTIHATLS